MEIAHLGKNTQVWFLIIEQVSSRALHEVGHTCYTPAHRSCFPVGKKLYLRTMTGFYNFWLWSPNCRCLLFFLLRLSNEGSPPHLTATQSGGSKCCDWAEVIFPVLGANLTLHSYGALSAKNPLPSTTSMGSGWGSLCHCWNSPHPPLQLHGLPSSYPLDGSGSPQESLACDIVGDRAMGTPLLSSGIGDDKKL